MFYITFAVEGRTLRDREHKTCVYMCVLLPRTFIDVKELII